MAEAGRVYDLLVSNWRKRHEGAAPARQDSLLLVGEFLGEKEPRVATLAELDGQETLLLVLEERAHLLRLESTPDTEEVSLDIRYLGGPLLGGSYTEKLLSGGSMRLWFTHDRLGRNPLELEGRTDELKATRDLLRTWTETPVGSSP
jgi:hypothetical protein